MVKLILFLHIKLLIKALWSVEVNFLSWCEINLIKCQLCKYCFLFCYWNAITFKEMNGNSVLACHVSVTFITEMILYELAVIKKVVSNNKMSFKSLHDLVFTKFSFFFYLSSIYP